MQARAVDCDAHRRDPARRHELTGQHRNPARGDAQDRDLVAVGVDRQQVLSVRSYLGRALGGEARAPGAERGVGKRGKGAVGVPGEPVDGIGRSGVAVRGCLLIGSPSRHRSGDRGAGRHRGSATRGRRDRRMV